MLLLDSYASSHLMSKFVPSENEVAGTPPGYETVYAIGQRSLRFARGRAVPVSTTILTTEGVIQDRVVASLPSLPVAF